MFYFRVLVFLSALVFEGCNDYEELPVMQRKVIELDSAFTIGQLTKAVWAKTPGAFCKREFSKVSNEGESHYSVKEDFITAGQCIVTIKEEGAIDDEVLGEEHIVEFSRKDSVWKVVSYRHYVKRRL